MNRYCSAIFQSFILHREFLFYCLYIELDTLRKIISKCHKINLIERRLIAELKIGSLIWQMNYTPVSFDVNKEMVNYITQGEVT